MAVVDIFRALGDTTRLKMIERLSRGPHTISSLSQDLQISRQGARKHIQILSDSKLITLTISGRDTTVELDQKVLDTSKKFITTLEQHWEKQLVALREFVDKKR
jgi:DNA-binding transcriptional ArsR family regulator